MLYAVAIGFALAGIALAAALIRIIGWVSPIAAAAFAGLGPAGAALTFAFC